MALIVPDYYKDFKCIADKCIHSCCRGWEIDIDPGSMCRFKGYDDITRYIKDGSFVLDKDGNCPFLRSDGLCSMILKYGEDMLCDICTDHPRFRNYIDDDEYMGIGLCCEEACRLIIDREEPFALIPAVKLPDEITAVQESDSHISQYIEMLCPDDISSPERADEYMKLERLDEEWTIMLSELRRNAVSSSSRDEYITANDKRFENLMIYFLYRHPGNIFFACESVRLIAELCISSGKSLYEVARMYSSEIEYSDVNMEYFE